MVIKGRYAYLLKILCLLILQLLITGAMECYSKADDKIGYLWVTSQPKFALIAIDDEYIDFLTPMKKPINLGTGIHTLQLYVNGYEPYRDKITIKRGQILEIKVTLARSGSSASPAKRYVEAYVTIGSIPAGADVCLDNVKIGKTPLVSFGIEAKETGIRIIKLTMPGYKTHEETIDLGDIISFEKEFTLIPLPKPPVIPDHNDRKPLIPIVVILASIIVIVFFYKYLKGKKRRTQKTGEYEHKLVEKSEQSYAKSPQEDILTSIGQITDNISDLRKELVRFVEERKNSFQKPLLNREVDIQKIMDSYIDKLVSIDGITAEIAKRNEKNRETILMLCQNLVNNKNRDEISGKQNQYIQTFRTDLMKSASDIFLDSLLNDGQKLVRIYSLISHINTLLEGKLESFVNKIKVIADEAKISFEEYDPMNAKVSGSIQYFNFPVNTCPNSNQEDYIESFKAFAKIMRQNIDNWTIIRSDRKDIILNEKMKDFAQNDIQELLKLIDFEKDNVEPIIKSQIEKMEQELFGLFD